MKEFEKKISVGLYRFLRKEKKSRAHPVQSKDAEKEDCRGEGRSEKKLVHSLPDREGESDSDRRKKRKKDHSRRFPLAREKRKQAAKGA